MNAIARARPVTAAWNRVILLKPFETFLCPGRRGFGTRHVLKEGDRVFPASRSRRHPGRHVDPRGELSRQRANELDLLVRKNFADSLKRHVAFAANQRLPAFTVR